MDANSRGSGRIQILNTLPLALQHYQDVLAAGLESQGIVVRQTAVDFEVGGRPRTIRLARALRATISLLVAMRSRDVVVAIWPAFGPAELFLWRVFGRRAQRLVVIHDPIPLRPQVGYGRLGMRLAAWGSRGRFVCVVAHTELAKRELESRGIRVGLVLPHPVGTPDTRVLPSAVTIVVAGQYKDARDTKILEDIAAKAPSSWVLEIAGRGWPALAGWSVDNRFLSEPELDALMARASAVLIPYTHYFQSGIATRAFEAGVPVVASRHEFIDSLFGPSWPGIASEASAGSWLDAIGRAINLPATESGVGSHPSIDAWASALCVSEGPGMERRALVLWADQASTNLGVRVLAEGTAELVRSTDGDAHVEFLSYGASNAPMSLGLRNLLLAQFGMKRSFARWLAQFDLVVDTGAGDSFADIYGLRRLLEMSLLRRLVLRSRVPLVMGPQTIGPFDTRPGRLLARWSTSGARSVLARDPESLRVGSALGLPNMAGATDTVFTLAVPAEGKSFDVLFNVSGLLWQANSHVNADDYQVAVLDAITGLVSAGRKVSLFPHVLESEDPDDDVQVLGDVKSMLASRGVPVAVVRPANLQDARRAVRASELVVGARMHACLNALSVGTPAIAWAYSRKFLPLMGDLGWTAVVDLRDSPAQIAQRTVELASLSQSAAAAGAAALAQDRLKAARESVAAAWGKS